MDSSLALSLTAPLAGALYLALSLRLGERFVFSRYSMYSTLGARDHGAVPIVLADGQPAEIDAFEAFSGISVADIYPDGIACSLEWRVRELERWVASHQAAPGAVPGPVRIELGFLLLKVAANGELHEEQRITARGQGRKR